MSSPAAPTAAPTTDAAAMIDRRTFQSVAASSAAATLGAGVVSKHRAVASITAADPVRVGFIGTGNQGMGLLKRLLQHDLANVVAVCDVNEGSYGYRQEDHFYGRKPAAEMVAQSNRQKGYSGRQCDAVVDARRVLNRDDVEAVFIVVPDHSHRPLAVAAAAAGKHIYCEKPLSLNIRDGQAMVAAVAEAGVVSQTGSHERSNPPSVFVCEAVKNGLVGDIKRIITKVGYNNKVGPGPGWEPMPVPTTFDYQTWLGTAPKVPYHPDRCLYRFRFNYDYSGGQVTNYGAHSNDMALWGMNLDGGGPGEVTCEHAEFPAPGSLFNTATKTIVNVKFASGIELRCQSGPENVQTRFEGTGGWIQTGYGGTTASNPQWLEGLPENIDEAGRDAPARHMADFFDCIRSGQATRAPFAIGHNTAALCHLINAAVKRFPEHGSQTLSWDHGAARFTNDESANELLG